MAEASSVGKFLHSVLVDPGWVKRRVETIELVDTRRIERRVTIDIDSEDLRNRAMAAGVYDPGSPMLPIPLTLLRKNLIFDIDVRDANGGARSILTSDEDSRGAHAVLLHRLQLIKQSSVLTERMSDKLYEIARRMPSQDDLETLSQYSTDYAYISGWSLDRGTEEEEWAWATLFAEPAFTALVIDFTTLYMPTVYIDGSRDREVLKYRYVESEEFLPSPTVRQRFLLEPVFALISAPTIGRAQREHLRIKAPPGIDVLSVDLGCYTREELPGGPASLRRDDTYESRVALERGVIYTSRMRRGEYFALARLQTAPSPFLSPALTLVAVLALLLLLGGVFQWTAFVLSDAQSTVTLLLAIPSFAAAYVARRDNEHEMLGNLLALPRALVFLSAIAALVAAASLVIREAGAGIDQSQIGLIWCIAGGYCLFVAIVLGVMLTRAAAARSRTSARSSRTTEDPVFQIPLQPQPTQARRPRDTDVDMRFSGEVRAELGPRAVGLATAGGVVAFLAAEAVGAGSDPSLVVAAIGAVIIYVVTRIVASYGEG